MTNMSSSPSSLISVHLRSEIYHSRFLRVILAQGPESRAPGPITALMHVLTDRSTSLPESSTSTQASALTKIAENVKRGTPAESRKSQRRKDAVDYQGTSRKTVENPAVLQIRRRMTVKRLVQRLSA